MSIPIRFSALVCAFALALSSLATSARADDPMAAYRERFKLGLERYKAGAVAEAIRYWEPIYRELGASKGYRVAFDLARAYETYGDFTRAAELYSSFVSEVEARRIGETIVPLVEDEASEAQARLAELAKTKGRIHVIAGDTAISARIDAGESRVAGFVAYVPPGSHEVVFGTGDHLDKREVTVGAGESIEVKPPSIPPPPAVQSPSTAVPIAPPPAVRYTHRVEHPFSPIVLYAGAGLTLVSVVVPALAHGNAVAYQESNALSSDPGSDAKNASIRAQYSTAKTEYYAALALPITLAAATCALTGWYFLGTKERDEPVVVPGASATKDGASLTLFGRF